MHSKELLTAANTILSAKRNFDSLHSRYGYDQVSRLPEAVQAAMRTQAERAAAARDRMRALGAGSWARYSETANVAAWRNYLNNTIKPALEKKEPAPDPPREPVSAPTSPILPPDQQPGWDPSPYLPPSRTLPAPPAEWYEPDEGVSPGGGVGEWIGDITRPITEPMTRIWDDVSAAVTDLTTLMRHMIRSGGSVILWGLPAFIVLWGILALFGVTAGFRLGPLKFGVKG